MSAAEWKRTEFLVAAAGGDANAVIPFEYYNGTKYKAGTWYSDALLTPQWHLPWLIQRYNAVNLMRYTDFNIRSEYRENNSGTDYYWPTASAARDAASATAETYISRWFEFPRFTLHYSEGDGWDCRRFRDVGKVWMVPREGLDGVPPAHYSEQLVACSDGAIPGTPGTGRVHFVADAAGTFADWSGAVDTMSLPATPAQDRSYEWGVDRVQESIRKYADYYPCFHFKPEE